MISEGYQCQSIFQAFPTLILLASLLVVMLRCAKPRLGALRVWSLASAVGISLMHVSVIVVAFVRSAVLITLKPKKSQNKY